MAWPATAAWRCGHASLVDKMIAQFKMHVRVVVEDDSAYKMDNARCRGLIKYVGKGTLFGLIGGRIQDVCHCALLVMDAPYQT